MKPGTLPSSKQRMRNRGNGGKKQHMPVRNQTFDSSGPDIRVRGNAHQVLEKYLALARDAYSQGDRIAAENYYQHAEHYFRVINASAAHTNGRPRPHTPSPAEDQVEGGEGDGEDGDGEPDDGDGHAEAINA